MPIKIRIRRNADGKIRETVRPLEWDESVEYLWSEGNWSCDCNRATFFYVDSGESYIRSKCSSHLFDVRITNAETGAVLYSEF